MRICKVWDAEYPWDIRAEKIARSLTAAGHDVHLVARNRDGRAAEERLPECTVHRLRPWPLVGSRLNAASMFPAFFNPRWLRRIRAVARSTRADLVLCRDLPLAPAAIHVGRTLGVPVVLDMAENYPAMIRALWENGSQRRGDRLIRNPRFVEAVERWVLPRVDHILVVVEESRDRLVRLGVPPDRMSVVSNTPPLERVGRVPAVATAAASDLHVVYVGIVEAARGLGVLLDGMAAARRRGIPVRLTVVGDGRDMERFQAQARDLQLGQAIRFAGRLPHAQAMEMLNTADVGVIPHFADDLCNTTVPNKLFDYMAAGLAVLTSDARPLARIVRETGCGEVYEDRDPEALATALARLADGARRAGCARAGRAAILERYHWELDVERLLASLEQAARGLGGAAAPTLAPPPVHAGGAAGRRAG